MEYFDAHFDALASAVTNSTVAVERMASTIAKKYDKINKNSSAHLLPKTLLSQLQPVDITATRKTARTPITSLHSNVVSILSMPRSKKVSVQGFLLHARTQSLREPQQHLLLKQNTWPCQHYHPCRTFRPRRLLQQRMWWLVVMTTWEVKIRNKNSLALAANSSAFRTPIYSPTLNTSDPPTSSRTLLPTTVPLSTHTSCNLTSRPTSSLTSSPLSTTPSIVISKRHNISPLTLHTGIHCVIWPFCGPSKSTIQTQFICIVTNNSWCYLKGENVGIDKIIIMW